MLCGIEEAGRGPLAGPVCAAAVILGEGFPTECLNDSKKLSKARRERAEDAIKEKALAFGIGWASHAEIDTLNILQASLLAMKRAFAALSPEKLAIVSEVVIDGLFVPDISAPCNTLVKADALIPEVMAASILAKQARDRVMEGFALILPQYGYDKHKGYPTALHRERIALYGPSPIQRTSFHPSLLQQPELFTP